MHKLQLEKKFHKSFMSESMKGSYIHPSKKIRNMQIRLFLLTIFLMYGILYIVGFSGYPVIVRAILTPAAVHFVYLAIGLKGRHNTIFP